VAYVTDPSTGIAWLSDTVGNPYAGGQVFSTSDPSPPGASWSPIPEADTAFKTYVAPPDTDNDGIPDATDNCKATANAGQLNTDGDTQGDACDSDDDNDGVPDTTETGCVTTSGPGISTDSNSDDDAALDGADAFPCNPAETADTDSDTVGNNADNCPATANAGQLNTDGDAQGDVCDPDDDGDGVTDAADACPTVAGAGPTGCATNPPAMTGKRAAALKKCTKKKGRARTACKKKAKKLPV
jgi:hypothetical protein